MSADMLASSYVRVLGGYYSRPDYFQHDVAKGTIRTVAGTRMCALTDDFLRGFRGAVRYECGKASDRVFKKCGIRWGNSFAARFDREISDHYGVPTRELSAGIVQTCLDEAFRQHGWGSITVDLSDYDHGLVTIVIRDSVMPAVVGSSDKPSDALMSGFLQAIFTHYAGTDLECHQTDCPSRGSDASRFLLGHPDRLKPVPGWVADQLSHAAIVSRLRRATTDHPFEESPDHG